MIPCFTDRTKVVNMVHFIYIKDELTKTLITEITFIPPKLNSCTASLKIQYLYTSYPFLIITEDLFQSFMNNQVNNRRLMSFHNGNRFGCNIRIPQSNSMINPTSADNIKTVTVIKAFYTLQGRYSK